MKLEIVLSCLLVLIPAARAATVNESAPLFTLNDVNGKEVSLKEFRGNEVVFVNFWASWCLPCQQELPQLNEFADEYKEHPLRVLAVNLDKTREPIDKFLKKMTLKLDSVTILLDPRSEVVAAYKAKAMPSSFIIDKDGVIRFIHSGYGENDPGKWRMEVTKLITVDKKK